MSSFLFIGKAKGFSFMWVGMNVREVCFFFFFFYVSSLYILHYNTLFLHDFDHGFHSFPNDVCLVVQKIRDSKLP